MERTTQEVSSLLQLDPNSSDAYSLRGDMASSKGDYQAAVDAYLRAIPFALPQNREYLAGLYVKRAAARFQLGDLQNAEQDAHVSSQFLANDQACSIRAQICDKKGDCAGAIAGYLSAIALNPSNAGYYNGVAWYQATCEVAQYRNGKEAVKNATRACELTNYKDANLLDTLAAAYAEAGDFENALTWIYGALDLETDGNLKAAIRKHAKLFENHRPYRDIGHTGN